MAAATLTLFVIAALLTARNEALIFRDEGRLIVEPDRSDPGAVVFYWRGAVEAPMAQRFAEAFDEWRYDADRFVIDLHSPGGDLREGEMVVRLIEDMKQTHGVDMRVRARRACYSMCVPIFLQGDERIAAPSARFMFHEPAAYDYFTGEQIDEPDFEKRRSTRRFVQRYFVRSPMDPEWLENLTREWRARDVRRNARQLVEEGSNIVTSLQ